MIVAGPECWDDSALHARIAERASLLRAGGLVPGQVVLCPDAPVLDLLLMSRALALLDAALFPFRAGPDRAEWEALAEATGAEWRWSPESRKLIRTGMCSATIGLEDPPLAALVKTSGSSGRSKIAMLSSRNLAVSAALVNQRLGFGANDVWLCCLRPSHIGGLAILYRQALVGASLVLHERFDAQTLADDLHRHAVTHVSLVPPMLARLLDTGTAPPQTLRVLLIGGQALAPVLAERALAAGWPLYLTYGMTETTSQIATSLRALQRVDDEGRVGPLLPGVEIDRRLSSPGPGRLRVRGPMVMLGYADPQRRRGRGLDNGWFETSDLGRLDEDGELRIVGRADDVLVIGGNNVSLTGVESLLRRAPGVAELVVVGLEDAVWGHRLIAVYRGSSTEQAFGRWCEAAVSGPERPRAFKRVAELPLLDSGKYDRGLIRALAQGAAKD
jgi:o-succinylbenzoate---CoA ligase